MQFYNPIAPTNATPEFTPDGDAMLFASSLGEDSDADLHRRTSTAAICSGYSHAERSKYLREGQSDQRHPRFSLSRTVGRQTTVAHEHQSDGPGELTLREKGTLPILVVAERPASGVLLDARIRRGSFNIFVMEYQQELFQSVHALVGPQ
jgi:hypothetical protein